MFRMRTLYIPCTFLSVQYYKDPRHRRPGFGMGAVVVVTRWLNLAEAAFTDPELSRHFRRERMVLRAHGVLLNLRHSYPWDDDSRSIFEKRTVLVKKSSSKCTGTALTGVLGIVGYWASRFCGKYPIAQDSRLVCSMLEVY